MPRLNWKIVNRNIIEAREQLEEIERKLASGKFSEGEFEVMITHAFHHLNFAWNIRRVTTKQYANLTSEDFNTWGEFPSDIELLGVDR